MARRAERFLVCLALGVALVPGDSAAFALAECGFQATAFSGTCATGYSDLTGCGCDIVGAPRWYAALLAMKVEDQGGADIDAEQILSAARAAARAWSDVDCSRLAVTIDGTLPATDDATPASRAEHGIYWVRSPDEWQALTGAQGTSLRGTTLTAATGASCSAREFVDADILLNGTIGGWTPALLKTTLLRLMGQALGLGNACLQNDDDACPGYCPAVMAAVGHAYATLQQDDVDGVCALYPGIAGELGMQCAVHGDCASGLCVAHADYSECSTTCGECHAEYTCEAIGEADVCVRERAPSAGEPCVFTCGAGLLCVNDGTASICLPTCDTSSSDACAPGEHCAPLQPAGGVCVPTGGLLIEGQSCLSPTETCGPGLVCVFEDASTARCYRECSPALPNACGAAAVCYAFSSLSGACLPAAEEGTSCDAAVGGCASGLSCVLDPDPTCARTCDQASACGGDHVCEVRPGGLGAADAGVCVRVLGSAGEGARCIDDLNCSAGLACLAEAEEPTCAAPCLSDGGCDDGSESEPPVPAAPPDVRGGCSAAPGVSLWLFGLMSLRALRRKRSRAQ